MPNKVDLKAAERRVKAMEQERQSFMPTYRTLTDLFIPFRGRYELGESEDKGRRRDRHLLNNSPLMARRILAAGIMSGATSPSQRWFRLTTGDHQVDRQHDVASWLFESADVLYRSFSGSNFYTQLQSFYNEISVFGTAVMGLFDDDKDLISFQTQTVGQYALGAGTHGNVDSYALRQSRQVVSIVKEFGKDNIPAKVKRMWDNGQLTERVEFLRLVEPNDERDTKSVFSFNKPYRSIAWVAGTRPDEEPLSVSGFDEFPFLATRWDVAPGDIYGTSSPGMVAIGDAQGLQLAEKDLLVAMDQIANPATVASEELRRIVGDRGPQPGRTYFAADPDKGIRSIYQTQPNITGMADNVRRYEERISDAFFKDLFLLLAGSQDQGKTATEVIALQEEKLLQLGPVIQRIHHELLNPLISRAFNILQRKGALPPPPDILVGRDVNVEYLSVLAQAQKLTSVKGLERLSTFSMQLAGLDPQAGMSLDISEIIGKYAEAVGVDPDVLKSREEVQAQIKAMRQAQAGQQALQAAEQAAGAAKDASQAGFEGDTALTRATEQVLARYGGGR